MLSLSGKVAVLTGATKGIGLAIAKRFAKDGAKVVISSRSEENVNSAVHEMKSQDFDVLGVKCHIADKQSRHYLLKQTLKKYSKIDILVQNAGVNPHIGPILDCSEEKWDKIFDVNVKSSFLICKEVAPHMNENKSGSIILTSTLLGNSPGLLSEFTGPYNISKSAISSMTQAMARQLGAMNIRINCVAPGLIETDFSSFLWKTSSTENEKLKEQMTANIALKRFGSPAEVAGLFSFLASDDASYMTGETIIMDGGLPHSI